MAQHILTAYDVYEHDENFGNGIELIKHSRFIKPSFGKIFCDDGVSFKTLYNDFSVSTLNSLGISAAITAYSRIYLSKFQGPQFNHEIAYTDTDSLVLSAPLPDSLVGPEIGKFKLEYKCSKFYAIRPKVYFIIPDDKPETVISKVAGYSNSIDKSHINDLMYGDNIV